MLTFVIIDDDIHLAKGVCDILDLDLDCHGFIAANGKDGLELIAQHQPDFIMCNLMMLVMPGDEVLKHLQGYEATKNIPFLMNSAAPESALRILQTVYGDDAPKHFICNPFDAEELLNQVKSLLDEYGIPYTLI